MVQDTDSQEEVPTLDDNTADAIKRILRHSWKPINFEYDKFTTEEQLLLTREQFDNIKKWMGS